jgi:hypothetical protein
LRFTERDLRREDREGHMTRYPAVPAAEGQAA